MLIKLQSPSYKDSFWARIMRHIYVSNTISLESITKKKVGYFIVWKEIINHKKYI